MQCAVVDVRNRREIQRAGELDGNAKRIRRGRGPILANREIERLGSDIILGKIGGDARESSRQRNRDGGMVQFGGNELFELGNKLVNALRRQIQPEQLDRNQTLSPRVISAKYRPKRACTNLMENPKRSEGFWSR